MNSASIRDRTPCGTGRQLVKTSLFTAVATVYLTLSPPSQAVSADTTDLGRRITLAVTNASPQHVFGLLAEVLQCRIKVDPGLKTPITLRVVDARIRDILPALSRLIDCEWRFDGTNLFIRPMPESRKRSQHAMDAFEKKLKSPLPAGMQFDGLTLKSALGAIGKAAGLKLRPWKGEGDRKVTLDVGGKTVDEALKALIAQIPNAEGVVMIQTPNSGMAQRRYLPRPPRDGWEKQSR